MNLLLRCILLLLWPALALAMDWEEKARQEAYQPGFVQGDPSPRRPVLREPPPLPVTGVPPAPRVLPPGCEGLPGDEVFDAPPPPVARHRSEGSIRRAMERNAAAFDAIYQRELHADPCLGGQVVLTIHLDAPGNVTGVAYWVSNPGLEAIAPKIVARTQGIRFGISSGADVVRYTLDFRPR